MVDALASAIAAAAGTYGRAVLNKSEDAAAAATVQLGIRGLRRWRRNRETRPAVGQAVCAIADDPRDADLRAVLRVMLKNAVAADPALEADLAGLVRDSGIRVAEITASGPRSIAVKDNSGIAATGDGNTFNLPAR
jgi:hypothetical protein